MVRAFALDAEHATQVWSDVMAASGGDLAKQAPNVIEPEVEIATRIGFGVVIGKNGLIAIDPDLAKKGFKSLLVHHDGKDFPAAPFLPKDKDGADLKLPDIALITAEVPVEPARIATRKNAAVGQSIFALGYELNASKKGFYNRATVTRGIVSRFGSSGSFQHDARLPAENTGGFILGEKGDVFGFFFQTQATGRTSTRKSSSDDKGDAADLGTGISTHAIAALLEKIPGQTGLRTGSVTEDMEAAGKELLASAVLVVATFEIPKPRKIAPPPASAATTMPPGTDPLPAGWSLSRTGTRHNAKCKFYNASYPCQATEGKACKVCGG
jgi:S1-C subfamily serine protease